MLSHIDFVSIGTNDLAQYTLAVDRGNSRVTRWYRQFHPAVLHIVKQTCDIVNSTPGKAVSICGEMAGQPLGVPFLIGVGMRYLSMNPWNIPHLREYLSRLDLTQCEEFAEELLKCTLNQDVTKLLEGFARDHGLSAAACHSGPAEEER